MPGVESRDVLSRFRLEFHGCLTARDHPSLAVSGAEALLRHLTVPLGSKGAGLPQKKMEGAGQVIRPGDGVSQMRRRLRGVLASATSR
jgi:hypothetical protein